MDPKFEVGSKLRIKTESDYKNFNNKLCSVLSIKEDEYHGTIYTVKGLTENFSLKLYESELEEWDTNSFTSEGSKITSDGGPSDYYDFPSSWITFNDFIEYKSVHQWKGFSFHLGNVGKAICRWGDKGGTTEEYDAKKIIYSATRVLMMIVGVQKTRDYLQTLLDDEQFKT